MNPPRVPRRATTLTRPNDPNSPQTRRERRLAERQQRRDREERKAQRPGWQSPMVLMTAGALVVGVVIIGAAVLMQNRPSGDGSLPADLTPPAESIPAGIQVDGQTMGDPNAPVTLQVYSDFQCPACRVFAEETEPLLRDTYVLNGTLKIVYMDAAFQGQRSGSAYDESVESAAAARCAGRQGEFWTYHDWLFANWDGENQGAFSAERLQAIADAIGLDRADWDACVASGEEQAAVRAATEAAVTTAGVSVTPTLNLNGEVIEGAASYSTLSPKIQAAAAAASPGTSAAPSPSPSPSP